MGRCLKPNFDLQYYICWLIYWRSLYEYFLVSVFLFNIIRKKSVFSADPNIVRPELRWWWWKCCFICSHHLIQILFMLGSTLEGQACDLNNLLSSSSHHRWDMIYCYSPKSPTSHIGKLIAWSFVYELLGTPSLASRFCKGEFYLWIRIFWCQSQPPHLGLSHVRKGLQSGVNSVGCCYGLWLWNCGGILCS